MNKLKILCVDDDIINRKLLYQILKKNPNIYEMLEANDGKEALEILNKNRDVGLIFLDIYMPQMDGFQMLEYLKKDPRFQHIPVIILSTDNTQKTKAMELGANDYIVKPIREEEIYEKINKYGSLLET